ncbi:MAG: hypothetical protein IKQ59_07780 [Prevotella sp.]|nr:hypothetical protein [Prevotella sp.]
MTTVANPIYDTVFKYLLEDERITRTILSALLKEEVIEVETKRDEYSNIGRDNLSVFRIDFGAKIKKSNGDIQLILIELQKTWLETETLRFRQYLGAQYANKNNMRAEHRGAYAIPLVTVYLLGHKVGDIEEPVLYVRRKAFDYNDRLVEKGIPDPFIDSLTHDSIIVQIPRLQGQVNNKLDKVLSFFNQTGTDQNNKQMLDIDETAYAGDNEMLRILRRLKSAVSDAKIRHEMNVEDEFFSVIESRDTDILMRDKTIAEQNATISEQSTKISEQSTKISEQSTKISEQSTKISEQSTKISEQSTKISEQSTKISEQSTKISEQSTKISEQSTKISEQNTTIEEQASTIRTSIQILHKSGMSAETIAENLNMDLLLVKRYIDNNIK